MLLGIMPLKTPLKLCVVSFTFFSLLLREVATYGFIYPNVDSDTSFSVGDTVNVSWTSSFSHPSLQLYCGYQLNRKSIADG